MSHTRRMAADVQLFDMLERDQLLALERDQLEAELERVHRMLDRVAEYQRAVLAARMRAEA